MYRAQTWIRCSYVWMWLAVGTLAGDASFRKSATSGPTKQLLTGHRAQPMTRGRAFQGVPRTTAEIVADSQSTSPAIGWKAPHRRESSLGEMEGEERRNLPSAPGALAETQWPVG